MSAGGGWEVEAGSAECWNESHRAPLASLRAGDGAHRDRAGKAWKMAPSAARVAGIASAAYTRVSTRPNTFLGAEWSHHMGRVQGYNNITIYKGSEWAPASTGAHASGRAGQHFDNLRCSCPIWHALNFEVMPRV